MRRVPLLLGISGALLVSGAIAVSMTRHRNDQDRYKGLRAKESTLVAQIPGQPGTIVVRLPGFNFQTSAEYSDREGGRLPETAALREAKRLRAQEGYFRQLANPGYEQPFIDSHLKMLGKDSAPGVRAMHTFEVVATFERTRDGKGFLFTSFYACPVVNLLSQRDQAPDLDERCRQDMASAGITYDNIANPEDINWALGVDDFRTYTPPSYR